MKKLLLTLTALIVLTACQTQANVIPNATDAEVQMAEMMGITVEELRNQTPEEHMQMMQEMVKKAPSKEENALKQECGKDGKPCSCNTKKNGDTLQANVKRKGGCGCGKAACAVSN